MKELGIAIGLSRVSRSPAHVDEGAPLTWLLMGFQGVAQSAPDNLSVLFRSGNDIRVSFPTSGRSDSLESASTKGVTTLNGTSSHEQRGNDTASRSINFATRVTAAPADEGVPAPTVSAFESVEGSAPMSYANALRSNMHRPPSSTAPPQIVAHNDGGGNFDSGGVSIGGHKRSRYVLHAFVAIL